MVYQALKDSLAQLANARRLIRIHFSLLRSPRRASSIGPEPITTTQALPLAVWYLRARSNHSIALVPFPSLRLDPSSVLAMPRSLRDRTQAHAPGPATALVPASRSQKPNSSGPSPIAKGWGDGTIYDGYSSNRPCVFTKYELLQMLAQFEKFFFRSLGLIFGCLARRIHRVPFLDRTE